MINFQKRPDISRGATVIFLTDRQLKEGHFSFPDTTLSVEIKRIFNARQFTADIGEILGVSFKNRLVVLAGLGKESDLTATALRVAVRKAIVSSSLNKEKIVNIFLHRNQREDVSAAIEAILIGGYKWRKYLTGNNESRIEDKKFTIAVEPSADYDRTIKICQAVNLTRDLVNDNADTVNSEFIEKKIRDIVRGRRNIQMTVLNRKELKAKGLRLHLAVNQGSNKEPKLIIVRYNGGKKSDGYTAIVGKGMTFDTGGLNLKPTGHIETMRIDMSGTGAVVGALKAAVSLNIKKNFIFVAALAENAIGSGAYKPGDVLISYKGISVEIGNTDAEGRLVLGDALAFVIKNYHPKQVIDLATLTGACVVALGYEYTGLMSNNDELAEKLLSSGRATDDRTWRLPLYPELKEHIKGQIADIKNVGLKGAAGTISAAEFLRQFVGDTPWAHLDIAGTAFVDGAGRWYFGHGATGAGVRLLTDFMLKK